MNKPFDPFMKRALDSFIIFAILGASLWAGLRTTASSTVKLNGFQLKHDTDQSKVAADLESYVLSHGFSPGDPPFGKSEFGVPCSAGEKKVWFSGNTENTRNVWVQLGTRKGAVDTAVAWQVTGFRYQIRRGEIRALQVMVDIARWREARPEEEQSASEDSCKGELKRLQNELAESCRE